MIGVRDLLDLVLLLPKGFGRLRSFFRPEPELLPETVSDEQAALEEQIAAAQAHLDRGTLQLESGTAAASGSSPLEIELLDVDPEMNFASLQPAYSSLEVAEPDLTVLTVRLSLRVVNNDISDTSVRSIDARIRGATPRAGATPNAAIWEDQHANRIKGRSWAEFTLEVDRVYEGRIPTADGPERIEIFVSATGLEPAVVQVPVALFV